MAADSVSNAAPCEDWVKKNRRIRGEAEGFLAQAEEGLVGQGARVLRRRIRDADEPVKAASRFGEAADLEFGRLGRRKPSGSGGLLLVHHRCFGASAVVHHRRRPRGGFRLLIGRAPRHRRVDFGQDGGHLGRGLPYRDRRERRGGIEVLGRQIGFQAGHTTTEISAVPYRRFARPSGPPTSKSYTNAELSDRLKDAPRATCAGCRR